MKRYVTDNPKNNLEAALNLFYIKDDETWVRGGSNEPGCPDITLNDYIRQIADGDASLEIDPTVSDEDLSEQMHERLFDGTDTVEGIIATLYTAAWAFSMLREKVKAIEDILGEEYDLDRLRELVMADRDWRAVVLPCKIGTTVYCFRHNPDGTVYVGKKWFQHKDIPLIGKNVFLTREEAEVELERMINND